MTPPRRARVLVSCGVCLLLLLAAVFRGQLLGPLVGLVLHQALGLHTTIARAGGSVLGSLDLRGVSARGDPGTGPLAAFEAQHVNARYSLAALVRGKQAFLDSLEVTLEGGRIDLDLTGPPAAGQKPGERSAGQSSLPRLPRLTVRDSRVLIRGPGYLLEAEGLHGAVARADQARGQAVEIRSDRVSLRHPAVREGVLSLAIAGTYAPRRLSISSAQVNGEPLVSRAFLDLGERPGDFDLQLALKLWQGAVEFGALRRGAGTEVSWDARGVDLQPQLLFVNPALGALRGRLTTSGTVRVGGGGAAALAGRLSLDWTGALLAGRAVDHLVLEAAAEPGGVLVTRAEGLIGPNEIRLQRVILPAAPLLGGRWRALLAASSGTFAANFGDVPAFLALWGVGAGSGTAAVPGHRLRLEGSLEKGRLQFTRGDLAAGPGRATLAAVTLTFPREDRGWGETAFSGGATVDIPDLKELSALYPALSLSGSLRGEVSGAGTFARPEGRASLTGRGVGVAGRTIGDVELQARGTAGGIEIDTLRIRRGADILTARDVRFATAALAAADRSAFFDSLAGSFAFGVADLPGLAALAGLPLEQAARIPAKHLLSAAGSVRGRAISVSTGSFAAAGGAITLRAARVVLPGPGADWKKDTTLEGDLEIDLPDLGPIATILQLPRVRGALTGRARISGSTGAPRGSVEASGRRIAIGDHLVGDILLKGAAQGRRLMVETLEISRGKDRLSGRGAYDLETGTVLEAGAEISVADVAPYLAEFVREGIPASGRLRAGLRATGPLPGTPLVVDADFSGGRIGDVQGVRGAAEARVDVQGTLRRPRVGAISLKTGMNGTFQGRPVKAALDASYEPGRLHVVGLELTGAGSLSVKGEGTIPVDLFAADILSPGPLEIRAAASIPALEDLAFLLPPAYALTGTARADAVVTGTWKEPGIRLEFRGERLQLPAGTRFASPGPATLAGTVTWGKDEARAEKVRLESPALSGTLSGSWSSPPSLSSLVAGTAAAATGSLALRTTFASPDLGWLRTPVDGLRGLRGSVAGEIAIDGPASDPVVSGEIRASGVAFRYKDLPPIDTLTAKATVVRRTVTLNDFGGSVGGSPFTLAGSVDFSRPNDPVLDLGFKGTNVLLYRDEGLRVRADSDLSLRGPTSALSLAGELALTNSLYQKNITVASLFPTGDKSAKRRSPGLAGISFPEPPLRNLRFDVRITGREPFQIKTSVVRGDARPDLRLTGTGLLPLLRGPILVDSARVMLPSGTLELERGTVLYREGDPDHPVLDIGGRMQARGYEITAQIDGTLDSPEVTLSSTPSLPADELLLFVLTGAPPGSGDTVGGPFTAMASPMAVYLGKNVVGRLLGGTARDGKTDFQDRIEVQIGREMTQSGSVTLDARLLLKKNPIGRGSTLYVTSEKDIYDQYNAGLKVIFKFK